VIRESELSESLESAESIESKNQKRRTEEAKNNYQRLVIEPSLNLSFEEDINIPGATAVVAPTPPTPSPMPKIPTTASTRKPITCTLSLYEKHFLKRKAT
jgi:hypothetical protein